jgi:hypothetical protein
MELCGFRRLCDAQTRTVSPTAPDAPFIAAVQARYCNRNVLTFRPERSRSTNPVSSIATERTV